MHGKGSFAVLLLVVALAVPPMMFRNSFKPVMEPTTVPWLSESAPEAVARSAPAPMGPPPDIRPAARPEFYEVVVIERDPMLSPQDKERLKPPPPPVPEPVPVRAPRVRRPRPEPLSVDGGIAIEGQERRAIINGRETGVGERVGRSLVVGIDLDGVTFERRGRTFKKKVGD